jgi:mRNA interferase MazF
MRLGRGAVVVVEVDPTVGHEQRGLRPCKVVRAREITRDQRFPLVRVAPKRLTPSTNPGDGPA